jgi:O-antigen/teichoic acid export membrane protein
LRKSETNRYEPGERFDLAMKEEILSLSKHTIIYGAGSIIGMAVSFIMLPVYTRYLSPSEYGVLELLSMTIDVIAMITGIGLASTVFKYYNEYEDPEEKKEVISTVAIMILVLSLLTAGLGLVFSNRLSQMMFDDRGKRYLFEVYFLIYFLQSGVLAIPALFMRAKQESLLFVLIMVIKLFIQVSLNIWFLVVLKMGVVGVLYSTLLADVVIGFYLSVYTFKRVGFRYSLSKSKQMIKFGYPFIVVSLSSFALTFSDRYFLNAYSTLATVGIYALAYKFGFLMGALSSDPFERIWEPRRFEIVKQENAGIVFKKVFFYLNLLIVSLSLFISLFVKDGLTLISNRAYHGAYQIVPIVILAYIIQAWTSHCDLGIYVGGRSKSIAVASVLSALGVILLNYILIPRYQAYGAAWATVVAFFIRFVLIYVFAQRQYSINYGWGKPSLLLTTAIVIYLFSLMASVSHLLASLSLNAGLFLLFGIIVYGFFLEESEKAYIKRVVKNQILIMRVPAKEKI